MPEPRTLTRKLIEDHLAGRRVRTGDEVDLRVDQVLLEDATATMAAMQFAELGAKRVAVPLAVTYVDHNVLGIDQRDMDDHRFLQAFSARHGLHYSRPGNRISHYVHLER